MSGIRMLRDLVVYVGQKARPPDFAIDQAEAAARQSPCQKSKRGAVVYRVVRALPGGSEVAEQLWADGCNGPPMLWNGDDPRPEDPDADCDGSEACRKACGRRCVHAEQRAMFAVPHPWSEYTHLLRMVHVKIDPATGRAVPGKGPSCIDCSRLLCDNGYGGIWLFEANETGIGNWRYYTAQDFHDATIQSIGLYQITKGPVR